MDNCPVVEITPKSQDRVDILCEGGRSLKVKGVVVTAGPWAKRMLQSMGMEVPLRTEKIPVYYWRLKGKDGHWKGIVECTPFNDPLP